MIEIESPESDLLALEPGPPPEPQPIAEPELGEGPHLSYAVQWFLFSAIAAVGWFLAVRRSHRVRP